MFTRLTAVCLVLLFAYANSTKESYSLGLPKDLAEKAPVLRRRVQEAEHTAYSQLVSQHGGCLTTISQGTRLKRGDKLCSSNGRFTFGLSTNGVFGIWQGSTKIWSPGTNAVSARLQSDGNFLVHDWNKRVLWRSATHGEQRESTTQASISDEGVVTILNKQLWKVLTINPNAARKETLQLLPPITPFECVNQASGRILLRLGQFICSPSTRFRFGLDDTGKLGLFEGDQTIWSAETWCAEDDRFVVLQDDGNLVLRNPAGRVFWAANSRYTGKADGKSTLMLANSGMVSIVNPEGQRVWAAAPNPPKASCKTQNTADGRLFLSDGEFICSPNAQFRFGVFDGDLSLWDYNRMRWSGGTCCANEVEQSEILMVFRYSAKLVVVTENPQKLLFSTNTGGNRGSTLRLLNDGAPKIVSADGRQLWSVDLLPPDTTDEELPPPTAVPSVSTMGPTNRPSVSTAGPTSRPPTVAPSMKPTDLTRRPSTAAPSMKPTDVTRRPSTAAPSMKPTDLTRRPSTAAPSMSPMGPIIPVSCIQSVPSPMQILPDEFVCSSNGQYMLGLASTGELVFLDDGVEVWSSKVTGDRLNLQKDGNLVLYSSNGVSLWSSNTRYKGTKQSSIFVGDDGVAGVQCSVRGVVWSTAIALLGRVSPDTLDAKVMTGYQGWFYASGDGGLNQWNHWSQFRTVPDDNTVLVDMWPDMSELDDDELFPTGFNFANGSEAPLYSAYTTKTVERHTRWMQEYNIDGAFLQRFIGDAVMWPNVLDKVLANIRSGSEKYGRTFAVMYDISNGDDATFVDDLINDWKRLVDDMLVTKSVQYLHHKTRPLLAIWGLGIHDREADYGHATEILDWFQYEAEDRYKATLMGGVPTGWRDLTRDSKTDPAWVDVYRRFDVLSPWTVGRIKDEKTADDFLTKYILPDMAECQKSGIDYLPVVFPGFSSYHLKGKGIDEIPRLGGDFIWHQFHNVVNAGNSMVYIAMFDEVDEGTAIFKISPEAPAGTPFLSLDAGLPNDWYLKLAGEVATHVHEGLELPATIPITP